MLLADKIALVTGGATGIGAAIAQTLVHEGARVAICDIDVETGTKTAQSMGTTVRFYHMDVGIDDQVNRVVEQIINDFSRVDILINNAGITNDKLLLRMTPEDWRRVIEINLTGVFLVTKAVIKHMIKQRYGKIVNIASVIGLIGNIGQGNYAASKAGVIGFTKSCAKELATRNITVNAIAPGFIETRMTKAIPEHIIQQYLKLIPMGRFGKPDDVAQLALFLSCDQSSYISGQVICIDGGMVM
jgi:3-oxoacyl-[acyl-carrier protein] reductase